MQEDQTTTEASQFWRADSQLLMPVLVDCLDGTEYPAVDADSKTIYRNLHFQTEQEAWKQLFQEAEAGIWLAHLAIKEAERVLAEAQQSLRFQEELLEMLHHNHQTRIVQLSEQFTLDTMPNHAPNVSTFQSHEFDLPQCCPVSGNPQPGSKVWVFYRPQNTHLEVYALQQYIQNFVGGQRCPYTSTIAIRDMETMIQAIAQHCAETVKTRVKVRAQLRLDAGEMILTCRAKPEVTA